MEVPFKDLPDLKPLEHDGIRPPMSVMGAPIKLRSISISNNCYKQFQSGSGLFPSVLTNI